MRFWDSSAIVPLLVQEEQTGYCLEILSSDNGIVAWYLTRAEVMSALCRRLRNVEIN